MHEKYLRWLIEDKYQNKIPEDSRLEEDLRRLGEGEPVDYVIGWKPFLNVKIDLQLRPFIPRVETEWWVDRAVEEIYTDNNLPRRKNMKILDLFAGSGAIGIVMLKNLNKPKVHFGEIDENCLKQIESNLKLNNLDSTRSRLIQTDVFSGITGKYDYVFANPPYVKDNVKLDDTIINYEPKKAFFGGEDGTYFLGIFFNQVFSFLKIKGVVYFEFGSDQKKRIENILDKKGVDFELHKDQFGRYRWGRITHNLVTNDS